MKQPLEVLELYPGHDYTLSGALESRAQRDPRRPFLLFEDKAWNWAEFGAAAQRAACLFLARGVKRGDRVGVMSRNHAGHVIALFALARIGAIMVPINPEYGVQEAKFVLHHAEVSGVIAALETHETARRACEGLAAAPWFMLFDAERENAPNFLDEAGRAPDRKSVV